MGKLLESLVIGNLSFGAGGILKTPEYEKRRTENLDMEQKVAEALPSEYRALLTKWEDSLMEAGTLETNEAFCQGVRFGILMMHEVFAERDRLLIRREE